MRDVSRRAAVKSWREVARRAREPRFTTLRHPERGSPATESKDPLRLRTSPSSGPLPDWRRSLDSLRSLGMTVFLRLTSCVSRPASSRLTPDWTHATTFRSVTATTFRSLGEEFDFTYGRGVGVGMKKRP